MIIKKFTGKTEKEATDAAKKELGDGIVVMNVRPVKKYGLFAFLRAPQTEVTVALEDEEERSGTTITPQEYDPLEPYRDKVQPKESAASQISKAALDGKIPPLRVSEDRPKSALESLAASAKETETETYQPSEEAIQMKKSLEAARAASNVGALSTPAPSSAISEQKAAQIEEKIDSLHDLLEKKIIKEESKSLFPVDAQKDKDNAALKEKEEKDQVEEETMNFVKVLYNTLLENEVDERYANQLTDEIGKVNKPGLPLEYALSNVYQKMVLKFGNPETITENAGKVRAEIFIGPTGVGKTTTIAKLASQLIITKKKKVALLTVDTYRIAATDQLKTYASILDIPFRVIYSTDEMLQAYNDFKDYDYVMLDTTGHSINNKEQMDNTMSFIRAVLEKMDADIFLVLSASTKYRDLIEIADAYSNMVKYKLIFTKMDETRLAGNLYNIRMHTGAPMSYITNGQDVPDDIAVFDAQSVVRDLLG
ncbi:MAG: flagellar biosynthesis protein FlhF [Lachnospiraceae bacterium]|nr:flagellar biosynthesis protein FlhF [Lachnospiraceae bacterium]